MLWGTQGMGGNSVVFEPIKNLAGEEGNLKITLSTNWQIIAAGLANCTAAGGIAEWDNVVTHRRSILKRDNTATVHIENIKNERQSTISASATGYWIEFGDFVFKQSPNTNKWSLIIKGMHGHKDSKAKVLGAFLGSTTTKGIIWSNVRSLQRTEKNWKRSLDRTGGVYKAKILEFTKAKASATFIPVWQ